MENYVMKSLSQNNRFSRRISKFQRELQHFRYLLKKGNHPIDIVDQLNHNLFVSMRVGLENKYPDAPKEEIDEKLIQLVENNQKLKKKRRGY